ncbi:MAG TPA: cytochrome c biogenesis protein CcdA [Verrucomicrobiae bacterium]|nr:cytochrome c biogenesis protein CcdA [Verrucomicrobiae bacterium]
MTDLSLAAVFLGGMLVLIPACGPALLPAFFAFSFKEKSKLLKATVSFIFGFTLVFLAFGLSLNFLVDLIFKPELVNAIVGLFLLLFSCLSLFGVSLTSNKLPIGSGTFVLGATLGLTIGGCSSPILASVVALSATSTDLLTAAVYLLTFEAGLFLPLVALSVLFDGHQVLSSKLLQGRSVTIFGKQFHTTNIIAFVIFFILGLTYLIPKAFSWLQTVRDLILQSFFKLNEKLLLMNTSEAIWISLSTLVIGLVVVVLFRRPSK